MSWILWVVACVAMYFLGFYGSRAFRKPYGPDRRTGERRSGVDRRQNESHEAFLAHAHERRGGDRRSSERRKPASKWPSVSVVAAAMFLAMIGTVSYAESQVGSIFKDQPQFINSGWAACDTPITWSVDTSRLSAADSATAQKQIATDLAEWGSVSGLTFTFAGEVVTKYDDKTFSVTSDTKPSARHLYFTFLNDADSTLLDARTVGFATPTSVYADRKEITEGTIVLSVDYVKRVSAKKERALYLHEIGHALGLTHGEEKSSVMFPIVTTNLDLSPADIAGIRAIIQECNAGT